MESRDPKTNRIVYEPGLEDGITSDYLAEMEKLGYRTDSVIIPEPTKKFDIITEAEAEEKEEELDPPGGWILLHGNDESGGGKFIARECNVLEVSSGTMGNPDATFVLIKRSDTEEPFWISVKESFKEVVEKIENAWRENYVNS